MRATTTILTVFALLALVATEAHAKTIKVPADFATIQLAHDDAGTANAVRIVVVALMAFRLPYSTSTTRARRSATTRSTAPATTASTPPTTTWSSPAPRS